MKKILNFIINYGIGKVTNYIITYCINDDVIQFLVTMFIPSVPVAV